MNQKKTTSEKKPGSYIQPEKVLVNKLLDFYWEILKDTDLKPSDRIASARRLEALLTESKENDNQQVNVILNLPEGKVRRGREGA